MTFTPLVVENMVEMLIKIVVALIGTEIQDMEEVNTEVETIQMTKVIQFIVILVDIAQVIKKSGNKILLMRTLLVLLLAAHALPSAINANSYDEKIFMQRWPIFVDNFLYGIQFQKAKDYEMMCERFVQANDELKTNFALFQKYKRPNSQIDLFQARAEIRPILKVCRKQYGIY